MSTLISQRAALVAAECNSYSPDAFPGSRQWRANKQARDALAAFDAAHPEVARAAESAAAVMPQSDAVARALRGED